MRDDVLDVEQQAKLKEIIGEPTRR